MCMPILLYVYFILPPVILPKNVENKIYPPPNIEKPIDVHHMHNYSCKIWSTKYHHSKNLLTVR